MLNPRIVAELRQLIVETQLFDVDSVQEDGNIDELFRLE